MRYFITDIASCQYSVIFKKTALAVLMILDILLTSWCDFKYCTSLFMMGVVATLTNVNLLGANIDFCSVAPLSLQNYAF